MIERVKNVFKDKFGKEAAVVSRAPGRLEILGNHTDYNAGTVLSVAVDRYMHIAAAPSGDSSCTLWDDILQQERKFDVNAIGEPVKGDWANYVKGMVLELRNRGVTVNGFNAILAGTVPLSAGMSSSAAFEMATGMALQALAGSKLDWKDMAKAGQACENNFIGAKTGLLDQFSSLRGKKDCLVYSDFRSLETESIAMPAGMTFVVINSMVKHVLTTEYNDRRASCEDACAAVSRIYEHVKALRDVPLALLEACRGTMCATSYNCALHVVGEITRVSQGIQALKNNDIAAFGKLMFQSHDSSRRQFINSCEELDAIIDIASTIPECLGARLSGGGFGGITVHLVRSENAEAYADKVSSLYEAKTGHKPQTIICAAAPGAQII